MASYPLIFPSLSRQPSMDSSKSVDDDTIRDQMESGYVATRPRFTRARRTWKINVRNLAAEDMRALDNFFMVTAARGANPFLYPNLLENWSFEFPALNAADLVYGWNISVPAPQFNVSIVTTPVEDGAGALSVAVVAGDNIPANTTFTTQVTADKQIPCAPGEVYLFAASLYTEQNILRLQAAAIAASVSIAFFDSNGNALSTLTGSAVVTGSAWQAYDYEFTVPANAASFSVSLVVTVTNTTGSASTLGAATFAVWDTVGCALLTPLTPYGRMAGSAPLGCLVRFSKLPETSDIGWGGGVKRYGANFELTEI